MNYIKMNHGKLFMNNQYTLTELSDISNDIMKVQNLLKERDTLLEIVRILNQSLETILVKYGNSLVRDGMFPKGFDNSKFAKSFLKDLRNHKVK